MKKKKVLLLLLALSLVISFCACTAPATTSQPPAQSSVVATSQSPVTAAATSQPPATSEAKKYTIINVNKIAGDPYWDAIAAGATKFGTDTGNTVINKAPTSYDAAAQLTVIQDAIAQKPDAITISPIDQNACEPILKQAMDAGIVVVSTQATGIKNVDWDVEVLVTKLYGAHVMDVMAKSMGETGEYAMMVGSLTDGGEMGRVQAAIDRQKEAYPNMKLATPVVAPSGLTADAALSLFKELLTTYPNLKGIYAHESTAQASQAVEEAGKIGKVTVIGYSLPEEAAQYLKNGSMTQSIIADVTSTGAAPPAVAVKVLQGVPIVQGIDLGYIGFDACVVTPDQKLIEGNGWLDITKDNVDSLLGK